MKFKTYWVQRNDGSLIQMRRTYGVWCEWLPFDNKKVKLQKKMNEHAEALQKLNAEYDKLLVEEQRIIRKINSSRDSKVGESPIEEVKAKLFPLKHQALPDEPGPWADFRSANQVSEQTARFDVPGMQTTASRVSEDAEWRKEDTVKELIETLGTTSHSLEQPQQNRRGKNRGGQQQQNN